MHKNLEEVQAEVSLQWQLTVQLVKEQINEALSNFYKTVDKSYYKLGSKIQYFGILNTIIASFTVSFCMKTRCERLALVSLFDDKFQ